MAFVMSQQVIVCGAGGQLGIELVREFGQRGWAVAGYSHAELDITDPEAVRRAVEGASLVLNAAAYNDVDRAETEPEAAFRANALAVRNLALACRDFGAKLVHYSTDYVFDGCKGRPYVESDATHPVSSYAVSKLGGELYAQAYLDSALVIRVCGVFGPAGRRTRRGNFVEGMLNLAAQGKRIEVLTDYAATPTYAPVIAARTADLLGSSGIYHMGGGTVLSWFDYARLVFELAGVDADLHPTTGAQYSRPARRPQFSALENARMKTEGVAPFPPLRDAIADYMRLREPA